METCLNYTDNKTAFFSSDEHKWINLIRKMNEVRPNEVKIIAQPEDNDGCIYANIPVNYLKIGPKHTKNFTEEQLEAARERMREIGKKRHANKEKMA